jgi:hypothetical protein
MAVLYGVEGATQDPFPLCSAVDATKVMMMAWVHPDNIDVDESHGVLVAKQNQIDSPDWMMGLTDTNLKLQVITPARIPTALIARAQRGRAAAGALLPCSTWSGTAALEVNSWAHVAVGVDGSQQKIYVGGVRMDTRACAVRAGDRLRIAVVCCSGLLRCNKPP